jgi:hypothetical protein
MKVLFTEGSSLTAREFLSVLGPAGHWIEVLDPSPACICRFSRWNRRVHPCPPANTDPKGYLAAVNRVLEKGMFDVLLPTHEQAWLLAAAGAGLRTGAGVAISAPEAFARVQSKIAFARLLDEVGLPQPRWDRIDCVEALAGKQPPFYLKAPYSTAGSGVCLVKSAEAAVAAFRELVQASGGPPLMWQAVATGDYAQVQGLFDHGRLVACHTSMQTAVGIGPSAAGRVSVDHPPAREDIAKVGRYLAWHGGLTLDYLFRDGARRYIECNPRTVEPANAAASGVDLPGLQLALSRGAHPPAAPPGRRGVRTHGLLAIILGTGAYVGTRRAVLRNIAEILLRRKAFNGSHEGLTPVARDFPSIVPLLAVAAQALMAPRSVVGLSRTSIGRYTVTRKAIEDIKGAVHFEPKETT